MAHLGARPEVRLWACIHPSLPALRRSRRCLPGRLHLLGSPCRFGSDPGVCLVVLGGVCLTRPAVSVACHHILTSHAGCGISFISPSAGTPLAAVLKSVRSQRRTHSRYRTTKRASTTGSPSWGRNTRPSALPGDDGSAGAVRSVAGTSLRLACRWSGRESRWTSRCGRNRRRMARRPARGCRAATRGRRRRAACIRAGSGMSTNQGRKSTRRGRRISHSDILASVGSG